MQAIRQALFRIPGDDFKCIKWTISVPFMWQYNGTRFGVPVECSKLYISVSSSLSYFIIIIMLAGSTEPTTNIRTGLYGLHWRFSETWLGL